MTSLRDIARKARVSIGTVDRVLHNRGRVSDKTAARVRRIIKVADYKPNIYARNLSLSKTYSFGVLMPKLAQDSGYWLLPGRGIARAQEELAPYRVRIRTFHFDRYDEGSFEAAADRCRRARPDGVLIAPVLSRIAEKVVPGLFRRIPHTFFDSSIADVHVLATVGQDAYQSGILAGNLMRKVLGRNGRVTVVKVLPADVHINERIRGFISALGEVPWIPVRQQEIDSRDFGEVSRRFPESEMFADGMAQGIFVSNAWTHGIARLAKSYKAHREGVRIIGYDLVPENMQYLQEGVIDFLISQRPAMQGYLGIMTLYRHLVLRERVQRKIIVPLDILTKDNLTYYQD